MITIPFLRHVYRENRLCLTLNGAAYLVDIPAVETMIRYDVDCPLYLAGEPVGNLYMSKSGSTIYADTKTGKFRFPYGFVVSACCSDHGYAIGERCTMPEVAV